MRQAVQILAALGVVASLAGCAATPAPPAGAARASDGAAIAWSRTGAGDTALVFIHGWSCNRAFWREQIDAFAADYTVVTLDLPGHGQSSGDREPWRVGDYGADVAAVVAELELERVVLIGHSMGGLVALRAAAELDGRALAVIAADSLHDAEIRYTEAQAAPAIAAFSADYAGSMTGMFTGMAGPHIDRELAAWIAAEGAASRPEVGIGLFANYTEIDATVWFREAGVPVRAINAAAGGMTPPTRTEANQQYADFQATILDGVGHFLQLEAPQRFNAALRETLSELGID